jgi:hypothetical protein
LLKEDYQARVHSDQMVLVIARRGVSQCEQRPTQGLYSLRMLNENWKTTLGSQETQWESRQSDSLKKSQLTLSLLGI